MSHKNNEIIIENAREQWELARENDDIPAMVAVEKALYEAGLSSNALNLEEERLRGTI